jgi:manganese/iron transport system permease protein/iron/zinc/copper transport system permease protein
MIVTSAVLGVVGFWVGFLIANLTGSAAGAAVVITMTAIFFVCLVFAPRYGLLADWIRKRNTVPQEIMEDVLGSVMRSPNDYIAIEKVLGYIKKPNAKIRKSIEMLERQGLLDIDDGKLKLTDDGLFEAKRLVRAHRLWETYLDQTSIPKEEIHSRAHELEHLQDQSMVDYLDDKLGHPITDPHGSEIPMDEKRILKAGNVLLAWLREGYRAQIVEKRPCETPVDVEVGEVVSMGERSEDGTIWTVITASGKELKLDHEQADSLLVAVEDQD